MSYVLQIVIIMLPFFANAKDLGSFGKVWDVLEENPVQLLEERANHLWQKNAIKTAKRKLRSPKHPKSFAKATKTQVYKLDPIYIVKKDVIVGGKVIYKKGDTINPIEHLNKKVALIFIDGSDKQQVIWAKEQLNQLNTYNEIKIILVGGNIYELQKSNPDIKLYFDQNGFYTKHFNINVTPTLVKTVDLQYEVLEVAL